ncbi:MAG: hypothetical protein JOY59_00150 [Candidatus Eremiobacteraeota bacterium]|nr:hypothetical protein [Candidatus Eremiobacteraeota bacterium]
MASSPPPAYVTVTDASGRVLFRRPATQAEVEEAIQIAGAANAEAEEVLKRIASERQAALAAMPQLADPAASAEPTEAPAQPLPQGPIDEFVPMEHASFEEDPFSAAVESEEKHDEEFDFLSALDDIKVNDAGA